MSIVTVKTVGVPDESTSPPTSTMRKLWMSSMVEAARASTVLTASSIEPSAFPESRMVLVMEDICARFARGTWYLVLGTWYLVLGTWYLVRGEGTDRETRWVCGPGFA